MDTSGGWEIDPNISGMQNQLYNQANIYIYSEYDINSQHQTSKISADSCWLPPGESTMLHQFRQTWHEHAWQSIDNSIYNIYITYIYLSIKTAYIIKRVCNEVTSPHEIDFNLSNHEVKTSMTSSQPCDMCRDASPSSLIDWWVQQPVGCADSYKEIEHISFRRKEQFLDLSCTSCISMNLVVSVHTHLPHIYRTEYHHKTIVCTFMHFCKLHMLIDNTTPQHLLLAKV